MYIPTLNQRSHQGINRSNPSFQLPLFEQHYPCGNNEGGYPSDMVN